MTRRILVIDAEAATRDSLKRTLEYEWHETMLESPPNH
jgi:DNA-binding NtrC family response regulator